MMRVWAGSAGNGAPLPSRGPLGMGSGDEQAATKVLVVDDDLSILDTVTAILSQEGYSVTAASSGEEALALLRTWHPTLVLLDMRMPVMDGWTVARFMRENGMRTPIIVMTAAENARRWADEIGASAHLAKPFALDDLLTIVDRFNRERRD
jgi:CheY-like chemotaxis protein